MLKRLCLLSLVTITAACTPEPEAESTLYKTEPVQNRTIIVAVQAAGIIEPKTTVEVKSKASGEILSIEAETGDRVERGTLLVQIDKRSPRNMLAQAEAELEAAEARRDIARSQRDRAKALLEKGTMNQVDYEQSVLEFANAKADVVRSQVSVENARIALADTEVRAPTTGTIIEKNVEKGQVISSPTKDVGGGTVLLKMANLDSVQVRTLVDETDIGKIRAGLPAMVTVAAYPQQPLEGKVLKIEPQAQDEQTVTMFAVLINLDNTEGLLRPGMNAEVNINIARSIDKPAIPTIALRTARDLGPASRYLGIKSKNATGSRGRPGKGGGSAKKPSGKRPSAKGGGRPSSSGGRPSRRGGGKKSSNYMFGGEYWVFVLRDGTPTPVKVKTGITDLEYSEVTSGLEVGDEVILLPSTGLIMSQERRKGFMKRSTGVPGMGG